MADARLFPEVAISTRWMFAHGFKSWETQKPFFAPTDGAELSLTCDASSETYDQQLPNWDYLSFYLSTESPEYGHIASLVDKHNPDTAVLHLDDGFSPELVDAYCNQDVPIAIENPDMRLSGGMTPEEIVELLDAHNLPIVFDVQNAYEHDSSMRYAWKILQSSTGRLAHFHVSGERQQADGTVHRHSLVRDADNREDILAFIDAAFTAGFGRPMIIEGEYESPEDVKEEVSLLKTAARGEYSTAER